MTHLIGGRPAAADRSHVKRHEADWLTAEEIGKHLNLSTRVINESLIELGYRCKEAKKPKEVAIKNGIARQFKHHGRNTCKWNRKIILQEIKDYRSKGEEE